MPEKDFYFQDNEFADLYLPLVGPFAAAIYSVLCRNWYRKDVVKYSVRELGRAIGMSPAAASRALQSLQTIGLIRPLPTSGNRKSECQLVDVKVLAASHGARREQKGAPLALPSPIRDQLKSELKALRDTQQGKRSVRAPLRSRQGKESADRTGFEAVCTISKRNASVSQPIRQRSTGETQSGIHLIQEKRRNEKVLFPTPYRDAEREPKSKDSPDEDGADELLKFAANQFTGVIEEFRICLLDTNRPRNSLFVDSSDDWNRFGFGNLAVTSAARRDGILALTLGANDSAAAQLGLQKYRKRWDAALLKWFGCKVDCTIQRRIGAGGSVNETHRT